MITVAAAGLCVLVGLAVQLSEAVAAAVYEAKLAVQPAPAATVVFAGQVMLGAVWSFTVTVKLQVPVLLLPSVAVKVTVWLPRLSTVPEIGDWLVVVVPQPPETVVDPLKLAKIAVQLPPAATVVLAGQVMVGGAQTGCTATVNVQLAVKLAPSVAVNVIV